MSQELHVQNADRNISHADYNHLGQKQLLVTNIWYSIQGEGPFAGTPAIFLRLAGCNRGRKIGMGCEFCDTSFQFNQGKPMEFDDVLNEMSRVAGYMGVSLVVITGGEPMLQHNLAAFIQAHRAAFPWRKIQIETNGDRLIPDWPLGGATIVASPKVSGGIYRRPASHVMCAVNYFKFLISADPDSPYHKLPDWALERDANTIYLSPMTVYKRSVITGVEVPSMWNSGLVDMMATRANFKHAAQLALNYRCRLSLQTHLLWELD